MHRKVPDSPTSCPAQVLLFMELHRAYTKIRMLCSCCALAMRIPVYSMLKVYVYKYLQRVGNVLNKLSCINTITRCLFAESEQCVSAVWSCYENYLSLQGDGDPGGVTSHSVKCRAIQWSSWDITNPENTQFYTPKPLNSFKWWITFPSKKNSGIEDKLFIKKHVAHFDETRYLLIWKLLLLKCLCWTPRNLGTVPGHAQSLPFSRLGNGYLNYYKKQPIYVPPGLMSI